MIADKPTQAAQHFTAIADQIRAFISMAREVSADGITWMEYGQLLVRLMQLAVEGLDRIQSLSGAEKADIARHAAGVLFDAVADRTIPGWMTPFWLLARGSIRSLTVALAGGAVEILIPITRAAR